MGWDSSTWARAWQYALGDTDNNDRAFITGARLQGWTGTQWARMKGDATNGLLVNLGTNNDVTVTGTVDLGATDNAVLDAIAASVAAIDTDTTTIIGHVDGIEGLLAGTLTVSGTVAVTNAGLTELAAAINASSQMDVNIAANGIGLATSAKQDTIIGHVDGIETLIGTTNTNTGNAATSLGIMDDWDNAASDGASVSGDVAHDTADAGEPVKIGYKAIAHGTNPTGVTANDRTNAYANRAGIPFVIGGHPNPITIEAEYTAAQTDTAIVTVSTGAKIVVTQIQVTADNANSVDVGFRVGFGTANTPTTTGVVLTHPGLQSGGVVSRGDGSGMLGVGADASDLRITSEVPTSGAIRVLVTYFTVES